MADEETGYDQQNNVSTPSSSANDKIYEPKNKRKIIRLLTVFAYVFFVSFAAIMLSLYYATLWNPVIKRSGARGEGVLQRRIQPETHYPEIVNEYFPKSSSYKFEEENVLPNKTFIQENAGVILAEEPDTISSYKIRLVHDENVLPNKTLIQENTSNSTEVIVTGEPDPTSSYMNIHVQEDTTSPIQDRIRGHPTSKVQGDVQGDIVTPVEGHRYEERLNDQLEGETRGQFTDRVY